MLSSLPAEKTPEESPWEVDLSFFPFATTGGAVAGPRFSGRDGGATLRGAAALRCTPFPLDDSGTIALAEEGEATETLEATDWELAALCNRTRHIGWPAESSFIIVLTVGMVRCVYIENS